MVQFIVRLIVLALLGVHIMLASHANYVVANELFDLKPRPRDVYKKIDANERDRLIIQAMATFASGAMLCLLAAAPVISQIMRLFFCRRV